MSIARHHNEWISLTEVSGPFLSMPVLLRAFAQGLPAPADGTRATLRLTYAEWDANRASDRFDPAVHRAWIRHVLGAALEWPREYSREAHDVSARFAVRVATADETLRPDWVLLDGENENSARVLVQFYPPEQALEKPIPGKNWKASPAARMAELLRAVETKIGLVTNGEQWMLIHAPRGETATYASWFAALWLDEPLTWRSFAALLGTERFFGVPESETLEALFYESLSDQQEVTDELGRQVRQALEVLVARFDEADAESARALLRNIAPREVYEGALAVMMRLVFLFCAEENKLLLQSDSPIYEENYSVSNLRAELHEIADQSGEELLSHFYDAWDRLLATFRLLYGGAAHDELRFPAYGGALFDPDRWTWLEGRAAGTDWKETFATPPQIDNRTVLHLLEALQVLQVAVPGGGRESRVLSFRALDIEQIGHVYEGLLDHTARRAEEPYLALRGAGGLEPEIALSELEREYSQGKTFAKFLEKSTGRSLKAVEKALTEPFDDIGALRRACGGDENLLERAKPFANLLRRDSFARLVVIPRGALFVTQSSDRRNTGTHYTTRALTEPLVKHTLDPLLYRGLSEGVPASPQTLISPREILALKICDPACGSASTLVQSCRYLSEKLVEAWENDKDEGGGMKDEKTAPDDAASTRNAPVEMAPHETPQRATSPIEMPPIEIARRQSTPVEISSREDATDSASTRESAPVKMPLVENVEIADTSTRESAPGEMPNRAMLTSESANENLENNAASTRAPFSPSSFRPHPSSLQTAPFGEAARGLPEEKLLPQDADERLILARRLIAERCLYGVDSDPLAVEMARLSLWLVTMQKCRPFTFLDHAIRRGDSLLGVDAEQIRTLSLARGQVQTMNLFILRPLQEARAAREELRQLSGNVPEQARRLRAAQAAVARAKLGADAVVAPSLLPLKAGARDEKRQRLVADFHVAQHADDMADQLRAQLDQMLDGRAPFHWPLEFPEVFFPEEDAPRETTGAGFGAPGAESEDVAASTRDGETPRADNAASTRADSHRVSLAPGAQNPARQGGFDAIVGNPPFQGGQRITGTMGVPYREYLIESLARGAKGSADLVAYFYLRAFDLLRPGGCFGLIATNTIAQGDTREVGLDRIAALGGAIYRAEPSQKWPGKAALEVAVVHARKGEWRGEYSLDGKTTGGITPFLAAPGAVSGNPHRLAQNAGKSFQGSIVLGMGFVLTPGEAQALIAKNPRNADVLFPYLNGEDLNSRPDQSPSRWVINFKDWPLDRESAPENYADPVAADYPDCLEIVERLVKPDRDKLANGDSSARDGARRWWQFLRQRGELYATIADMPNVLAISLVTAHVCFEMLPANYVYAHRLAIAAFSDFAFFSILNSNFHEIWARKYSSSLSTTINYSPSDCFDTFPFPLADAETLRVLAALGAEYHGLRASICRERALGLTKVYNLFHDAATLGDAFPVRGAAPPYADLRALRALHQRLDEAVARAYGWDDVALGHDFHVTAQGARFTLCEAARREILDRLLALNHARYAEEVTAGLHMKGGAAKRAAKSARGAKKAPRVLATPPQGSLEL